MTVSRMMIKKDCYNVKSMACQIARKAYFAAEEKQKISGCEGDDYHHGWRIHWDSIAWAVTTCVSVGAIGVVVAKKVQAFN